MELLFLVFPQLTGVWQHWNSLCRQWVSDHSVQQLCQFPSGSASNDQVRNFIVCSTESVYVCLEPLWQCPVCWRLAFARVCSWLLKQTTFLKRTITIILCAYPTNCRVSTGENWQEVMLDCLGGQPCHEAVLNNTSSCGSDFAYVFFPSFYFVSSILVNLI